MNILYISCHAVLEFEELTLLTELNHEVFSVGAYIKPEGHYLLPRPKIEGMKSHPELEKYAVEYPKTHLPDELISWCDTVIIMHDPNVIEGNWESFKRLGKKVIWRSIGQSTSYWEDRLKRYHYEGMKIIRMSKKENNIVGFMGSDILIPFPVDGAVYTDWIGQVKRVINLTQSLKGRRQFCHYDAIMRIINNIPALIYGSGNSDLGGLNGGELPWELMKGTLRDSRCFLYGGTWPSPYTLSIQEAMAVGIPVVILGKKIVEEAVPYPDRIDYYELPDVIVNRFNGFISDDIETLRSNIHELMEDDKLAQNISREGRKTALDLWEKEKVKDLWKTFLESI